MINLEDFKKLGLEITWTLIEIGLNGKDQFQPQLNSKDVIEYAVQKLLLNSDESEDVILLAGTNSRDIQEVRELLRKLAKSENINSEGEFKKWEIVYILKLISNLSEDFIQGLLDIGDAWAIFDFPDDSPHIFQGKGNTITPKEYYTKKNFEYIIIQHKKWLCEQIQKFKK